MYDIHTRTRNFCKLCTPVPQYPGYEYALLKITGCGCGYEYGYNVGIPTRDFCEFRKTSIPVPGTSVSFERLPYPYLAGTSASEKLVF